MKGLQHQPNDSHIPQTKISHAINFELAQLLYFQGRLEQAREKMKFFTADQPEKAQWWLQKWPLPSK